MRAPPIAPREREKSLAIRSLNAHSDVIDGIGSAAVARETARAPAQQGSTAMTHAVSFATAHDVYRGHVSYTALPLLARNDNNPGDERCPACHRPMANAPSASEYRGKGIVHHHWRCGSCGHAWMTVAHISA
jgi:hypothetical protein